MAAGRYFVKFPEKFIWGVACASYQCEGGWDADGKGPNIWDEYCHDLTTPHIKDGCTGDVACDSYHLYKEDVALMRQCNIKAYRFSVSWARVIPDGDGEVNEAGLRYYDNLIDELIANGIEPMVTLYHWDLPAALSDKGGWMNRDIVKAFGRYAHILAERFKGRVTKYMTLNEPQCTVSLGYGVGAHAPGLVMSEEKQARAYHILCLAHSEAYRQIKEVDPDAQVGIAICGNFTMPAEDTPACREAAYKKQFDLSNGWAFATNIVLDSLILRKYDDSAPEPVRRFAATVPASDWDDMRAPDFVGTNIYHGTYIGEDGKPVKQEPGYPMTACKWPFTPEVLHYGPLHIWKRYGIPVIITENGQSCNDRVFMDGKVHDPERIDFLHRYLLELAKAIEDGVDLRGYLQWSFLDNFEWSQGYTERFGIIYVDYTTQKRIPKDSAKWYADTIAANGENL